MPSQLLNYYEAIEQASQDMLEAARNGMLSLWPLDCALVSPAGAPFMPFQSDSPDFSTGLRFSLYNNKWGTNFPMWWAGSIAFRFILALGTEG